jgi:hypothetical protein
MTSGIFREPSKVVIRAGAREDLCVLRCHHPSSLTLERPGHERCTATLSARLNYAVDEVNELIGRRMAICLLIPAWYLLGTMLDGFTPKKPQRRSGKFAATLRSDEERFSSCRSASTSCSLDPTRSR